MNRPSLAVILISIAAAGTLGFLGYKVYTLNSALTASQNEVTELETLRDSLIAQYASSTEELAIASTTIAALAEELSLTAEELDELEDDYRKERNRNEEFEDQIKEIAGTVGDLDKLSKTDEELLQKYSKVYFLNEHYVPSNLSRIENDYVYDESRTFELHTNALPFLEKMIDDAEDDGISIWVASAYRSFAYQSQLKGAYTVTYGSGANTFSADQGFSEHQLGTTVDLTTTGLGGGLDGFGTTPAYTWLLENAHKYGFVLSYPENNQYYVFEPWHWRFVGEELAEDLHDSGQSFYDWDQRKINEYLLNIFD